MPRIHVPEGMAPLQRADELAPAVRAANRRLRQATLDETRLPITEIEVLRVRSAQLNGCETCLGYRMARDDPARAAGAEDRLTDAFYAAIVGDGDLSVFTDRERIVRELTERFITDHFSLDDDEPFWARVRDHFDDAELVELTMSIASFMMSARFNHVLGLDTVCDIDWPGKTAPRLAGTTSA